MPPRVLVADDDHALRVFLHVLLTRAGFDVDFAQNGREAFEKVSGDSYAVLMVDLILPEVSGIELLERIEREKPEMLPRTIVVTGASRGIIDRVDTSRIHAVLRKPFDIEEVIRLTAECAHEA